MAHDQAGGEPRFSMLETVREYALEQLTVHGETNDWRGRHAAFFLGLAEHAEPHLRGVAYVQGALAALAADGGDVVRARGLCEEGIATFRQLADARGMAEELRLLGRTATLQGDDRGAVAAVAECLTQRHVLRTDMTHVAYADQLAATRAAFGTAAFDVAWSAGQRLPIAQAITEALAAEAGL